MTSQRYMYNNKKSEVEIDHDKKKRYSLLSKQLNGQRQLMKYYLSDFGKLSIKQFIKITITSKEPIRKKYNFNSFFNFRSFW